MLLLLSVFLFLILLFLCVFVFNFVVFHVFFEVFFHKTTFPHSISFNGGLNTTQLPQQLMLSTTARHQDASITNHDPPPAIDPLQNFNNPSTLIIAQTLAQTTLISNFFISNHPSNFQTTHPTFKPHIQLSNHTSNLKTTP